jgi:hypothetical protein
VNAGSIHRHKICSILIGNCWRVSWLFSVPAGI